MELIEDWMILYVMAFTSFSLCILGNVLRSKASLISLILRESSATLLTLYSLFIASSPLGLIRGTLALLTALIAVFVIPYTNGYERHKYPGRNLSIIVDMFVLSIYMVFVSETLLTFIMFWLFAEIVGFFTIVFEVERRTLIAGLRYLIVSMVPADLSLLLLLALTGLGPSMNIPLTSLVIDLSSPVLTVIAMLGFMAKAAVAPLHFWLPDAYTEASTQGSMVLSAILSKFGAFGIFLL
ncbi:MAG: proton-conducting transporter membrane subunit, partial [Zestosphaera sp.]